MTSLNWKVLCSILAIAAGLAILNNLRVPPEKRVTWFGGQIVFPAPESVQP